MEITCMSRLAALLVSYGGYYRFLRLRSALPASFIPLFVCCAQGVVVFLAGLVGMMLPAAYVLCAAGWALGAASFVGARAPKGRSAAPWVLAALMGYALVLLYGKVLTYNDDFSHWGLIARVLLANDRLPTEADALLSFTSYPPGTACFLYYVCRVVGSSCEWGMMMAQAALLLSAVVALLPERGLWYALPCTLVTAWFAIGYDVQLTQLMVDSLMPMMAAACVALVARMSLQEKAWEWMLAPVLGLLVLVKNSALIFAAFVWIAWIAAQRPKKLVQWLRGALLLAPAALLLLWRAYASANIPGALNSMHSMSFSYIKRILSNKTMLDVLDTAHLFKERLMGEGFAFFLCFAPLTAMALLRLCGVRLDRLTRSLPWLQILWFGLYEFGLLCTYVFSMHVVEASLLLQYDRYQGSMTLYMLGVLMVFGFGCVRALAGRAARAVACGALAMAAACVALGRPPLEALAPADQSGELRVRLEAMLEDCPRGENLRYLQAIDSPDLRADSHYCARYLLWNGNVTTANVHEGVYTLEWYESVYQDYDYLIVQDAYPAVEAFVAAHYPQQAGQAVIRLR